MMDLNAIWTRINKFGLEAFGLYYSNYPAYVVDNEDPNNQGRVLVLLATILGPNSQPVWAYPKGIWSGDDCGVQILPEIKDVVWVEFQQGKITAPIWSFYHCHVDKNPVEFRHPKTYGIKTPAGYLVTIDEIDKILLVKTPEGSSITIDESGVSIDAGGRDIHVHNDTSSVSITDSGIEISSDKSINVGGQFPVLYSTVPEATSIVDVKEIGVSKKVKVG